MAVNSKITSMLRRRRGRSRSRSIGPDNLVHIPLDKDGKAKVRLNLSRSRERMRALDQDGMDSARSYHQTRRSGEEQKHLGEDIGPKVPDMSFASDSSDITMESTIRVVPTSSHRANLHHISKRLYTPQNQIHEVTLPKQLRHRSRRSRSPRRSSKPSQPTSFQRPQSPAIGSAQHFAYKDSDWKLPMPNYRSTPTLGDTHSELECDELSSLSSTSTSSTATKQASPYLTSLIESHREKREGNKSSSPDDVSVPTFVSTRSRTVSETSPKSQKKEKARGQLKSILKSRSRSVEPRRQGAKEESSISKRSSHTPVVSAKNKSFGIGWVIEEDKCHECIECQDEVVKKDCTHCSTRLKKVQNISEISSASRAIVSKMSYVTPWGRSGWYSGEISCGVPNGMGRMLFEDGDDGYCGGPWANGYSAQYLQSIDQYLINIKKESAPYRRRSSL